MAPKATPRKPLVSSRSPSSLNDQDVLTLWHAFRNNGGNLKPNFQALGNCLGITAGGARARFHKVQAFFEETRQSPRDGIERKAPSKNRGDQAKPKREAKKNPKKEASSASDNESVTSLVLISDGETDEAVKIETPTQIKAEPDLVVKDEFVAI